MVKLIALFAGTTTKCVVFSPINGVFSTQSILYCDGSQPTFSGGCEQYVGGGVYQPISCTNTATYYVCRKNAACSKNVIF